MISTTAGSKNSKSTNRVTKDLAEVLYDILVAEGGARVKQREEFVRYMTNGEGRHEWRFSGNLGFGGK